jgi:hypothetical protein
MKISKRKRATSSIKTEVIVNHRGGINGGNSNIICTSGAEKMERLGSDCPAIQLNRSKNGSVLERVLFPLLFTISLK